MKLTNALITVLSILIGLRVINLYLKYETRPTGSLTSSYRIIKGESKSLKVIHPINYEIKTKGMNTIILVGDSMGVGRSCGNAKNIAGCLKFSSGKHIVNLSESGKSTSYYLSQLQRYFNYQRDVRGGKINGEKVFVIIYSNDILLDKDKCNYYNRKEHYIKSLTSANRSYIEEFCFRNTASKKIRLKPKSIVSLMAGKYSANIIEKSLGQLTLSLGMKTEGRASYARKWGTYSAEMKLVASNLSNIQKLSEDENFNVVFAIFPNVEDITKSSKIYQSYDYFIQYVRDGYGIKIHNGYKPFIDEGIKIATYSSTDAHGSCKSYKIFSDWLLTLDNSIEK